MQTVGLQRVALRALAVFLAMWLAAPAGAIILSLSDSAHIRLAPNKVPAHLSNGSYTVFAWVWRESADDASRAVIQQPDLLDVVIDGRRQVRFTFHAGKPGLSGSGNGPTLGRSSHALTTVHLTTECDVPVREWVLIAASFDRAVGRLDLWVGSQSLGVLHAAGSDPQLVGGVLGPLTSDLVIGGDASRYPAFRGAYGPIVIRRHAIGERDFTEVFDSRRYFAAWDHSNLAQGGRMDGPPGCVLALNLAMSSAPNDAGVGGSTSTLQAAYPSLPASVFNVHMWDEFYLYNGVWTDRLRSVHPMASVGNFVYASHREPPFDGWFVLEGPGTSLGGDMVAGWAPRAREIVDGLAGPLRVMVSANSRAVNRFDGSGRGNGNYMHGFIAQLRPRISGVMFRPADVAGLDTHVWFGFETNRDPPRRSPAGTIVVLQSAGAPLDDFTRTFTLSTGPSAGPGAGLLLRPEGFFTLRCRPENGSLVRADAPLIVEAIVLRYPGSPAAVWRWDRGPSQGGAGVQGPSQSEELDTTEWTRILGAGDVVVDPRTIELEGLWSPLLRVGMMAHVVAGEGHGASSVIESVVENAGITRLTFEHPFGVSPGLGSEIRFGEWGLAQLRHEFDAVAAGDPNKWRGIHVSVEAGAGTGVAVLAYSAWREDVGGIIVGCAGQGGRGYTEQLDNSFRDAPRRWMALTRADVWFVVPAQQSSTPPAMSRYTAEVAAALPRADIIWAGEMAHAGLPGEPWHRYILDESRAEGVVGLASLEHPRLGSFVEQLADGMRSDGAHLSARGGAVMAGVWLEMLDRATSDPCAALDFVEDGRMDVLDFLEFANRFSQQHRSADLDRSATFDIFDFLIFTNVLQACQ